MSTENETEGADPRRPTTSDARRDLVRHAVAILRVEYAGEIRLDDVAQRVATSPRQLRRAFSEVTGRNFRDYLTRVRMEKAAELLVATELPVAEIGRRVCYREPSQFAKAFRRVHGVPASEFRHRARHQRDHGAGDDPTAGHSGIRAP